MESYELQPEKEKVHAFFKNGDYKKAAEVALEEIEILRGKLGLVITATQGHEANNQELNSSAAGVS